jgi:hypothetical protein
VSSAQRPPIFLRQATHSRRRAPARPACRCRRGPCYRGSAEARSHRSPDRSRPCGVRVVRRTTSGRMPRTTLGAGCGAREIGADEVLAGCVVDGCASGGVDGCAFGVVEAAPSVWSRLRLRCGRGCASGGVEVLPRTSGSLPENERSRIVAYSKFVKLSAADAFAPVYRSGAQPPVTMSWTGNEDDDRDAHPGRTGWGPA